MLLTDYLLYVSCEVTKYEIAAANALKSDNKDDYKRNMKEKALILASLYDEAITKDTDTILNKEKIFQELYEFSSNAQTALSVNSPWYMSELLYPEDYMEGDLNNLQKLIEQIEYK